MLAQIALPSSFRESQMKNLLKCLLLAAACHASIASADVLNFTLQNAVFDDGGVATGTFSTDSATGALLSYDIVTTSGTVQPGFHYDATTSTKYGDNIFHPNSFLITRNNPFAQPYIDIVFDNPLTSTGVDNFTLGSFVSHECDNCANNRNFISGSATTSVPEPASVALLGLGLLGFVASRRKSAK